MAVLERRSRLPAVAQLAVAFWLAATSACLCRSVIPDPDLEPGRPCVGRLFCRWPPLPLPSPPPPPVVTPPPAPETTTPPPRHHHTPPFCPSPLCRHRLPPHLPRPIYPPPTPLSPESPPLPPPPPVVTPPRDSDAATSIPYPSSMYLSVLSSSAAGLLM
ncbi:hypothetical protein ZEAMMB73_Zm00001d041922 [Zea mays]|uniref:Uncharacterized protein n=1 Tax=Zea mays TaxID=4577 RepID=A0A1D6MZQ8_MAIZE|nr:hypothetical protein ZEAMMB73_Zm00001d041922 [Zea mays]